MDSDLIIRACKDVLGRENVNVILTTGHHELPEDLLPLPDNFHFAAFLPGLKLAEKCDLLVHHGGYGSCQTGLFTGTPAVIIPTFSERESNARRIAAAGAGEYVLPKKSSSKIKEIDLDEFREKLKLVLADSAYQKKADMLSQRLKEFGGPNTAARLINEFVSKNYKASALS